MRPILLAMTALLALRPLATHAATGPAIGVWSNPKRTLDVQTAPCGPRLCGTIVRASEGARADAREAGVTQLIGLQLLQDYRPVDAHTWRGRVYVPDMGRRFSSRIEQLSPDTLRISGCLIGNLFCKSQLWQRVK